MNQVAFNPLRTAVIGLSLLVSLDTSAASPASAAGHCPSAAPLPATTMAVRVHEYGGSEQLRFEQVPMPTPAAGEVLVRVQAASVNPIDWKLREGIFRRQWPLQFPAVLGVDGAGVVVALGDGVGGIACGDEVVVLLGMSPQGTYAEYAPVKIADLAPKPAQLSFDEAAAYPLVALTAWDALQNGHLQSGQRVLIHGGAGGVGSMAVQIAKARGAYVIATASANNHEYLRSLGADEVIDYRNTRFEDVVQGVDLVLDTVGGETAVRSRSVVKPGGHLVTIAGRIDPAACADAGIVCPMDKRGDKAEGFAHVAQLIERGQLRINIDQVFPLEQAAQAQELNRAGHTRGKIVLRVAS